MSAGRVRINRAAMNELLRGPTGPVVRHIATLTRRTESNAKQRIKVDEGTARASIGSTVQVFGPRVIGRVGTPLLYPWYLHEGTGIFGPRGTPIRPIRRQFLRFEVKSGTAAIGRRPVVFAREVAGIPGDKWLLRALQESVPYPVSEG